MSSNWFNQWCSKSPTQAQLLLADMRAMGIDVPSLELVPEFTEFDYKRPRALEEPLPLYIFSTLHLRRPDWENTHQPNGYIRKSLYSILWFGVEEVIREDGKTRFSVIDLESHKNRLRSGLPDLFPLSEDEFRQVLVPNADLTKRDLSGIDISGRDLSHSQISVRVVESNLTGTDLSFAKGDIVRTYHRRKVSGDWESETFVSGTDFSRSILNGARLIESRFEQARFHTCSIAGAKLDRASLKGSAIYKSDLERTSCIESDFAESFIEESNFRFANLEGAIFAKSRLFNVSFEGAHLKNCSFRGADLRKCRFSRFTNLAGADFTGATFDKVQLQNLNGVDLGGIGLAIHSNTTLQDGSKSHRNAEVLDSEDFLEFRKQMNDSSSS